MGLDLVPSCWTVQFCRALAAVACLWHFFLDMTSPLFVMWFGLNLWQVQASLARLGFRLRISATMHLSPVISHLSLVSVVSTWTCWMLALVGLSWLCLKNGWNMFGCSVESLNVHHAVCVCVRWQTSYNDIRRWAATVALSQVTGFSVFCHSRSVENAIFIGNPAVHWRQNFSGSPSMEFDITCRDRWL